MLLVLVTAYTVVFEPSAVGQLRGDVVAGFFYGSNWYQLFVGLGYTAAFDFAPLRHLWSLAVEEQFYLLFHDCLTEDFDHQISLNRQNLQEGVCISYDFGMAFSNHYFPPFYTMELGISDTSILEHRLFLLEVLSGYSRWVRAVEGSVVSAMEKAYPATCQGDRCRYYLRNYKAHFRTRLYFGRFFEKILNAPFEKQRVEEIADTIQLDMDGISNWKSFVEIIQSSPRRNLDLRGLNLSYMDLRRADLKGADLTGANLAGADLEDADMRGAKLSKVDMRGTNLKGVKLDKT